MSLGEWLGTRSPAPPPALAHRIADLIAAAQPGLPETALPEQCLAVAEHALRGLLASDPVSRDSALDLLAIDALVTYAFEAQASEADAVPRLASDAIRRLSAAAGGA